MNEQMQAIQENADAVKRWLDTDMDDARNRTGLIRALDRQRGDVKFLLKFARKQQAAIDSLLKDCDELDDWDCCGTRGIATKRIRKTLEPAT